MIDKRKISNTIKELDTNLYKAIEKKAYSICDFGRVVVSDDPNCRVVCDYANQPETIIGDAFSLAKRVLHTRVQAIWGTSFFNLIPHEFVILSKLVDGIVVDDVYEGGVQVTLDDSERETAFSNYYSYLRDGIKTEISDLLSAFKLDIADKKFTAGTLYMMEAAIVEAVLLSLNARSGIISCDIRSVEAFAYALRVLEESFDAFKFVKLLNGEEVLKDIDILYGGNYYTHQLELGELVGSLQGAEIVYDTRELGKEGTDKNYSYLRSSNRVEARFLVCFNDKVSL